MKTGTADGGNVQKVQTQLQSIVKFTLIYGEYLSFHTKSCYNTPCGTEARSRLIRPGTEHC